jgi:hypothetical protein
VNETPRSFTVCAETTEKPADSKNGRAVMLASVKIRLTCRDCASCSTRIKHCGYTSSLESGRDVQVVEMTVSLQRNETRDFTFMLLERLGFSYESNSDGDSRAPMFHIRWIRPPGDNLFW